MILGILTTFLSSISAIFWKKALTQSRGLSGYCFDMLSLFLPMIVGIAFILLGYIHFQNYSLTIIGLCTVIAILRMINIPIEKYVYKKEKLSVLTPYENLGEIFTIILGFIIFQDVSIYTFFIALIIVFFTTLFSIDFKKFRLPKIFGAIVLYQGIKGTSVVILGLVMKKLTNFEFFFIDNFIAFIFLLAFIFWRKEFLQLFSLKKSFYKNRFSSSFFEVGAILTSLYIIAEFGIILNLLFGFLYVVFTMIMGYIFLQDTPDKKSILLSIITVGLVALGYAVA